MRTEDCEMYFVHKLHPLTYIHFGYFMIMKFSPARLEEVWDNRNSSEQPANDKSECVRTHLVLDKTCVFKVLSESPVTFFPSEKGC